VRETSSFCRSDAKIKTGAIARAGVVCVVGFAGYGTNGTGPKRPQMHVGGFGGSSEYE